MKIRKITNIEEIEAQYPHFKHLLTGYHFEFSTPGDEWYMMSSSTGDFDHTRFIFADQSKRVYLNLAKIKAMKNAIFPYNGTELYVLPDARQVVETANHEHLFTYPGAYSSMKKLQELTENSELLLETNATDGNAGVKYHLKLFRSKDFHEMFLGKIFHMEVASDKGQFDFGALMDFKKKISFEFAPFVAPIQIGDKNYDTMHFYQLPGTVPNLKKLHAKTSSPQSAPKPLNDIVKLGPVIPGPDRR
ncbi:MAG: hypothetical protein FWF97_03250 [Alphaproteobacteria bacterium]|nr:hypothetical protein [Alphaproteobacteria bacterium]